MSVRIYQLSKEIGMENAELIELLRERGYEVKSASSTVDNISAESLREEFSGQEGAETSAPEGATEAAAEPVPEVRAAPTMPVGAIVRTKEDIERERLEREKEEEEKRQAELASRVRPPEPPGKTPPPLPRVGAVVKRGPFPAVPPKPASTPAPGRGPVLRTDIKPEPVKEEAPVRAEGPPLVKPPVIKQAPATGPMPVKPPPVSGPKSISPPKASATAPQDEAPADAESTTASESGSAEPQLHPLQLRSPIVVRDFATALGRKPFQLISELMELGIFASMNSPLEEPVAIQIARKHGFNLEVRHRGEGAQAAEEKKAKVPEKKAVKLEKRPPVVCILGHVDHGKTTLLDSIRKANVVAGEAGGITQHIGAYQVEHKDHLITFIDTPGHAAFSNMRARGARTTDIAVLVVAADDGFMPQTDEALGHARSSKVPVVVAINKIDAPGANVDRVLRQMQDRELAPEAWGGETLSAEVSALKGEGLEDLLDSLLLQAEVTEGIEADPRGEPHGVILEAQKELGRGSTASVIVQSGTLKPGMALVCGEHYCRIRQIMDDKGKQVKEAEPSKPVKVIGWSGPPDAGDVFKVVKNERTAKKEAEDNAEQRRKIRDADSGESAPSLEGLFAAIEKTQKKTFRVLVKADVYGTAEALATSLLAIHSEKIDLEVVDMGVGDVTRNDITMASAANAAVVGFNIGLENGVNSMAKHESVQLIQHNIIYELINQVKDSMADLLEPELRENKIGAAEIRALFPLGKGTVAGCMVTEGRINRDAPARLVRNGEIVAEARISTLKRFKDDATEVRAGYECGVQLEGVNDYREKDSIEVYEILKIKPDL